MNPSKVEGERGRTFEIDLEDPLQKRYEMVRELILSSKPRTEICDKYGYTRKTGNEYLRAWNEKGWEGHMEKPRGPKTKSKRTKEVERRIVDMRFRNLEKDMYDIAKTLKSEGYEISARSVARVLAEHGITLKKNEEAILASDPKEKITNTDVEHLLIKSFHTNYGGAFLLLPYLAILGLDNLVCNLGIEKTKGISTLQNVLTLLFLAISRTTNTMCNHDSRIYFKNSAVRLAFTEQELSLRNEFINTYTGPITIDVKYHGALTRDEPYPDPEDIKFYSARYSYEDFCNDVLPQSLFIWREDYILLRMYNLELLCQ